MRRRKTIQYKTMRCTRVKECQNRMRVNHICLVATLPSIHILSWYKDDGTENEKRWKRFKNQGMDSQEGIDNVVLIVGLAKHDLCVPITNFFTINLPTGCTEDVRA